MVWSLLASVLAFGGIILFHELGHFLLARKNGVTVVEFSAGFGPRLLSYVSKKSGTRYSLKLLPFGGSCAMLGEFEEGEERPPEGEGGSFFEKSPLARMAVIAAGPIFNFLMAFVLALVILSWAGLDRPVLFGVTPGQPAEAAGLMAGDRITKLGSRNIRLSREISMYLMTNGTRELTVEYQRFQEETGTWEKKRTSLTPVSIDGRNYLGVQLPGYRTQADSLLELLRYGVYEVRFWLNATLDGIRMMGTGNVKSEDLAGPVRIVSIIDDTVQENTRYGMTAVLMNVLNLMVMLSTNLGVMNLLPFPALDGGRLVFLFWEFLTKKPVNQRVEGAVTMTGMALLMGLMALVLFNDIKNLV